MDSQKAKKAFAAVKSDMQNITYKIERIERSMRKKPQKDKEIDQILSALQSLKAETFENTTRIEALNTVINGDTSSQETISYQKDIEDLRSKLKEIEAKQVPVVSKTASKQSVSQDQKIENTFNEFSEIMNEKIQIEMNSLRLEFTEEIAKLYDKCFNEILSLKAQLDKQETKQKQVSSPRTLKTKKEVEAKEEKENKESKLKKISKFLFVDEDEDDLKSIKNQVEDKEK